MSLEPMEETPCGAELKGEEEEATAPGTGHKIKWFGKRPPARRRVCRVEVRRNIMQCSCQTTPVEEVVQAAKNAVLGDQGAAGFPPEQGMEHGMVVNHQVQGGAVPKGSQGQSSVSSKQFCGLLCQDPRGAREEACAHAMFPNANIKGSPWCLCCICKETWGRR